jgi:hypothetical protein
MPSELGDQHDVVAAAHKVARLKQHGRQLPRPNGQLGDTRNGLYADEYTYGTTLCNIWSGVYGGSKDECLGASANEVGGSVLAYHNHYSHYYTGQPCNNS